MSNTRPLTQRQLRRMEQLVRDHKLERTGGGTAVRRRLETRATRSSLRAASTRIETVQSYLHVHG